MSGDDDAFAGGDIDAFTVEHLDEFERTESFYLDNLVDGDVPDDGVKELAEEGFGIPLRDVLFRSQLLSQLRDVYSCFHGRLFFILPLLHLCFVSLCP